MLMSSVDHVSRGPLLRARHSGQSDSEDGCRGSERVRARVPPACCKLKLSMTSYNMPRHPISSPLHSITVFSLVLNTEYSLSSVWHPTDISHTSISVFELISTDIRYRVRPASIQSPDSRHWRHGTRGGIGLPSRASRRPAFAPRPHDIDTGTYEITHSRRGRCTRARPGDTIHTRRVELPSPLHPWISTSSPPMASG